MSIDLAAADRALSTPSRPDRYDPGEVADLPEPVRRYFDAAIAPGTQVAEAAALAMRGHLKLRRWVPFRAEQVLAPHRGFVWRARAAGIISGYDAFVDGEGAMEWKLLGLVRVMAADGPDVSTSAAGRSGGEGVWVPTALLPRFGVRWSAPADDQIVARFVVGPAPMELHLRIDAEGLVRSVVFDRWGDPEGTGTFGWHPFGGDVTGHRTFHGATVPCDGRWGWSHGTDRWSDGEFIRIHVIDLVPR
ncbi:hypothetical protein HC251_08480 [Iamia sp. SCSIO 61187]|uniref:DUF6544 family protein n=1 Tax=Iamia sp. SCSIO 61187 TaxID=2722752 RepID=UPI001C637261|nr:DUF6544 family protein [Iamia sp. SCSIO 61187]QYG92473.1 hypothetical protein HC251_08480 [Iamia sp. SCSIO 61187]